MSLSFYRSGATQTPGTPQPSSPEFLLPFPFFTEGALLSPQHPLPQCECPSSILEGSMSFGGVGFKAKRFLVMCESTNNDPTGLAPW